jgi:hypothetical protein
MPLAETHRMQRLATLALAAAACAASPSSSSTDGAEPPYELDLGAPGYAATASDLEVGQLVLAMVDDVSYVDMPTQIVAAWTTSDDSVARVETPGDTTVEITGMGAGDATITAYAGTWIGSFTLHVTQRLPRRALTATARAP